MGLRPVNKKEGLNPKSLVILFFENTDFGLLAMADKNKFIFVQNIGIAGTF